MKKLRYVPLKSRQVPQQVKDALATALPWAPKGWRQITRKSADGQVVGEYLARVKFQRFTGKPQVKSWFYADTQ